MPTSLPFHAVLWDMDGVIVDSYDGHYHAWQRIFNELGHHLTEDEFARTFGMNNRLILYTILNRKLPEDEFQAISDRKEEYFRESIRGSAQLLPGVAAWLECFKDSGIKQAVASSAPQANIDAMLNELGIRHYFQAEAAGAAIRGKPDPAVFLLAAEMLDVPPQACLVIEDAIAGVEAAKRGGMKCVAVLTTNSAEKLSAADLIVKDLTELTFDSLRHIYQ